MRDRSAIIQRKSKQSGDAVMEMGETPEERKHYERVVVNRLKKKGILTYIVFLFLVLGIPLYIVSRYTPFFIFQNVRCRLADRVWSDRTVTRMEEGYARYFNEPPLFPSEAYNRTVFWGTYEPSRIFAMKSMADKPLTIGFAWYDEAGLHPIRHMTPYLHNKVRASRYAQKRGRDPEVMTVRWVTHDGIHYGSQRVEDPGNKASIEFEFLKSPSGNAWHVRVHGRVESPTPLTLVLYVAQGDIEEDIEVLPPDTDNDGDWSPLVQGMFTNALGKKEPFQLRVRDDHQPFEETAPWGIYGLHMDAEEAFSLKMEKPIGGTASERAATHGKGITGGRPVGELQDAELNLRRLPAEAFTYIFEKKKGYFRSKPKTDPSHNMLIMKKSYDSSFRLELSFSPAFDEDGDESTRLLTPTYSALSTCQLKNLFRRREKAIYHHVDKIFRPWVNHFNVSASLMKLTASSVLSEAFGSLYYGSGRYKHYTKSIDRIWDETAEEVRHPTVEVSSYIARAPAPVGSRTDEPFGQQYLAGLQSIFLVRWNKEMVKHWVGGWLLDTQDPVTGFIPSLATFSDSVRSLTALELRYEHPTWGSQPTLLFSLQELLREMQRKAERTAKSKSKKKARNRPEYIKRETESDNEFLKNLLPALRRWRSWWHSTQCGGADLETARHCESRKSLEEWPTRPTVRPEDLLLYRWRSRTEYRIPASGMDDYVRPVCPGEHQLEAHVDLFSWVALLSSVISQIESHLGVPQSVTIDWEAHLNAVHWDAAQGRYADRIGCASRAFSPYTGYVNLFPVLTGVVRDTEKVQATLHLAREELWSPYGLMAMSFDSVRLARESGIRHDNLFAGYVWPSVNLLFVYSLQTVYWREEQLEEARRMYEELHTMVASTIRGGSRWWEYFNPLDGRGEGSKTYIGTRALFLGLLDDFS